jgi:hypothetical protein
MDKIKVSAKKAKATVDQAGGEVLPTSFKKFRQLPEMEAFYRFIYENDLRKEGKMIIDRILLQRKALKAASKKKASVRA